nr:zinc finger protein 492-like [Biomphalaria glabrata]
MEGKIDNVLLAQSYEEQSHESSFTSYSNPNFSLELRNVMTNDIWERMKKVISPQAIKEETDTLHLESENYEMKEKYNALFDSHCQMNSTRLEKEKHLLKEENVDIQDEQEETVDNEGRKVCSPEGNQEIYIDTKKMKFQCEFCMKMFKFASPLKSHQRVHTGEKPFKCQICPKEYSSSAGLKMHKVFHTGEKPYKCQICHKAFSQSSVLKTHLLVHTNDKSFQCPICLKIFSSFKNTYDPPFR